MATSNDHSLPTSALCHFLNLTHHAWSGKMNACLMFACNVPNDHSFECTRFACVALTFAYYFLSYFSYVSHISFHHFHFHHSSLLLFIPSLLPSLYLFLYLHSTPSFHHIHHLTFTTFTTKLAFFSNNIHHSPLTDTHFRNVFGVDPAIHVEEMSKAEQVMLDSSWSAKITITGMYHFS